MKNALIRVTLPIKIKVYENSKDEGVALSQKRAALTSRVRLPSWDVSRLEGVLRSSAANYPVTLICGIPRERRMGGKSREAVEVNGRLEIPSAIRPNSLSVSAIQRLSI